MEPVLSVTNLTKIYPKNKAHAAVDSISFQLKNSEILGLLGPNGSGKTTTIQMLLGTLSLTSGSIVYFGKDFLKYRSELLQFISFASAYTSLPWLLTVEETLKIFGRLYNLNPKESSKLFEPLLERFGILNKKSARISSLSAGQITRLMLIKAFFIQPKIVLLDEPTASLDPDMANEICSFILEQREKTGLSILFTSHKMEEVAEICDRVVFLKNGKIIADDLPKKLAQTVSSFRVRLVIIDGMKRISALIEKMGFASKIEHRTLEITIQENQIPSFLNAVGQAGITYANIKIEEPSLEEYFLHMAKKAL
jgi:ABC-2 type transport system ATP-binding protein